MPKIQTLYVVNHSHTDIGFTDYQDLCFRQHAEFIDQALDLIEATRTTRRSAVPLGLRSHRHDREVLRQGLVRSRSSASSTGTSAASSTSPACSTTTRRCRILEQMIRSLYPVRRLRDQYGLNISTAMQCDVNGISWLYADLLPEVGIELHDDGGQPAPRLHAEADPRSLLVGRAVRQQGARLERVPLPLRPQHRQARRLALRRRLPPADRRRLEADPDYPFDFMYAQSTHPIRVDNGPPDPRMPEFVQEWNDQGRTPRIEFTTPAAFNRLLRDRYAQHFPTRRGDWLDWWSDGVALQRLRDRRQPRHPRATAQRPRRSAPGSPAKARRVWATERARPCLRAGDALRRAHLGRLRQHRRADSLWSARASGTARPSSPTPRRWRRTTCSPRTARALAGRARRTGHRRAVQSRRSRPTRRLSGDRRRLELLVVNTLPWPRKVIVEEPEQRGGARRSGCSSSSSRATSPGAARCRTPRPARRRRGARVRLCLLSPLTPRPRRRRPRGRRRHDRKRPLPRRDRPGDRRDRRVVRQGARPRLRRQIPGLAARPVRLRAGRVGRRPPGALLDATSQLDDFGVLAGPTPPCSATDTDVGRRSASRSSTRAVASIAVEVEADRVSRRPLRLRARRADADRSASTGCSTRSTSDRDRGRLHRLSVQSRRARFRARSQRRPVHAGRGPAQRHRTRLVSRSAAGSTSATASAASPSRRSTRRSSSSAASRPANGPELRAGGPDPHVLGAQQPLDGQLQGESGRRDSAPLPTDHATQARATTRPRTGGPPRRRRRRSCCATRSRRGEASGRFAAVPDELRLEVTAKPAEDGDGVVFRIRNLGAATRRHRSSSSPRRRARPAAPRRSRSTREPLAIDGPRRLRAGRRRCARDGPRPLRQPLALETWRRSRSRAFRRCIRTAPTPSRRSTSTIADGELHGPRRPFGLRQDDVAADGRRASRTISDGEIRDRRTRRQHVAAEGPRHRDGVPELRALPAHVGLRQHGASRLKLRHDAEGADRSSA